MVLDDELQVLFLVTWPKKEFVRYDLTTWTTRNFGVIARSPTDKTVTFVAGVGEPPDSYVVLFDPESARGAPWLLSEPRATGAGGVGRMTSRALRAFALGYRIWKSLMLLPVSQSLELLAKIGSNQPAGGEQVERISAVPRVHAVSSCQDFFLEDDGDPPEVHQIYRASGSLFELEPQVEVAQRPRTLCITVRKEYPYVDVAGFSLLCVCAADRSRLRLYAHT